MAWTIRTNDLAVISSFEAAEKHWNEGKEWKNEHASWRPLAGRRKTHIHLVKLSQGGYECVLFETPIVTYYPDGSVKLIAHNTQSTLSFARYVSPPGCTPVSHKGHMFWCVDTPGGEHYQYETMVIAPVREGVWVVTTPAAPLKEWVLDRKKAAEVRKLIKPYAEWYEMTSRLIGKAAHGVASRYAHAHGIGLLLDEPTRVEAYPELMHMLGHPLTFRQTAYEVCGARTQQPVPRTRLPRKVLR